MTAWEIADCNWSLASALPRRLTHPDSTGVNTYWYHEEVRSMCFSFTRFDARHLQRVAKSPSRSFYVGLILLDIRCPSMVIPRHVHHENTGHLRDNTTDIIVWLTVVRDWYADAWKRLKSFINVERMHINRWIPGDNWDNVIAGRIWVTVSCPLRKTTTCDVLK